MKRRRTTLLLLGTACVFVMGLVWLFRLRLHTGDIYPAYSTLRADPLGTRALYDALTEEGEMEVERHLKPLAKLPTDGAQTIFFFGLNAREWQNWSLDEANALDQAVQNGAHVVMLLDGKRGSKTEAETAPKPSRPGPKPRQDRESEGERNVPTTDWTRRWGISFDEIRNSGNLAELVNGSSSPEDAPDTLLWHSNTVLRAEKGAGWQPLYMKDGAPVLMSAQIGKGHVVLGTDSFIVSNESLLNHRSSALLAYLVGEKHRILWVETHLGVVDTSGVAALARRYGLAGGFVLWCVFAALCIWRRSVPLVPPSPEATEAALNYHPTSGLSLLFQRTVPSKLAFDTAYAEWAKTASDGDRARARTALEKLSPMYPTDKYNAVQRALKRKLSP